MKNNNLKLEIATFAGGCFWCTEAIFKRLKGIKKVIPGYTGGKTENPSYEEVSGGMTGHAEAIQIEFDPEEISYDTLLEVFFKLHDPTTLNRQGYDVGTEYRSAIFYHDNMQKEKAEAKKEEVTKSGHYKNKIVTEVVPFTKFYEAENYHKNYYENNKDSAYCKIIIDPKITKLYKEFGEKVKKV